MNPVATRYSKNNETIGICGISNIKKLKQRLNKVN